MKSWTWSLPRGNDSDFQITVPELTAAVSLREAGIAVTVGPGISAARISMRTT